MKFSFFFSHFEQDLSADQQAKLQEHRRVCLQETKVEPGNKIF